MTPIQEFAELVEKEQIMILQCQGFSLSYAKTRIIPGKKYTKVDVGNSGKYMVDNATGEIFGIKGYGVIHKGHRYGTLDTIHEYFWGEYKAFKKG